MIRSKNLKTRLIGCPKTIDGDLKCKEVPTSFGFDTACKVTFLLLFSHYLVSYVVESVCLLHQKKCVEGSLLTFCFLCRFTLK